jgi:hypothetical protein
LERHFVSYPKSGRSWIRYMFTRLGVTDFVRFHHDRFEFSDDKKPLHDFDIERRLKEYASVGRLVYFERDPRDIMVSLFHQVTGRFRDEFKYEEGISAFLRDDYFGAANLRAFRSMWNELSHSLGALRLSYEECHLDTLSVLRRLVDHYGLEVASDRLAEVVAESTFDRMRDVEETDAFDEPWLRRRHGAAKMRRGKAGGFRDSLSAEDIAYLNDVFGL